MKLHTVKALSDLAGVSVRTLHHYDQIGLLKLQQRSRAGHRLYGQNELLRLQQILFFKELDFPLPEIRRILETPDFDLSEALRFHREKLSERANRLQTLLLTIDSTMNQFKQNQPLSHDQLYAGFDSAEQGKAYRKEASQRWGEDRVKQSEARVRKLTPQQWKAVQDEAEAIYEEIASLMHLDPSDAQVQAAVAKHYSHLKHFYEPSPQMYAGLADLYFQDERFTAFFEKIKPGLAAFMSQAMKVYAEGLNK